MNMSKAMIVTVLSRIEDSTMETTGDNWYAQSLAWATAAGLTDATDPEAPVTRVDMVRMLYKYAGSPTVTCDLSAFADAGELSGDGLAAMQWAVKNGIVIGNGLGLLDPAGYTTRSIFATLLMRYCAFVG